MELKRVIEAVLFAGGKQITVKELKGLLKDAAEFEPSEATEALKDVSTEQIREAVQAVREELDAQAHPFTIQEVGETFQFASRPDYGAWIKQLFDQYRPQRLSQSALETLAIIAYRQPITRADIEAVRGVQVDAIVQTLMERGLVKIGGRAELPGRPMLLETTQNFLEHFGLKSLDELPNASELKQVNLPKAKVEEAPANPDAPVQQELPVAPEATAGDLAGDSIPTDEPQDTAAPEAPIEVTSESTDENIPT